MLHNVRAINVARDDGGEVADHGGGSVADDDIGIMYCPCDPNATDVGLHKFRKNMYSSNENH